MFFAKRGMAESMYQKKDDEARLSSVASEDHSRPSEYDREGTGASGG